MNIRRLAIGTLALAIGCAPNAADVADMPLPAEDVLSVAGSYQLTTPYQTTVEELGAGSEAIELLIDLRNPTVLLAEEIADETNLPAEIVAVFVEDALGERGQQLEDSIDDVLGETIDWQMESRLVIAEGGIDARSGLTLTHYAVRLHTTIEGDDREFDLDRPATADMATADVSFDDPRVSLREHTMVLDDLSMLGTFIEARLAPAIAPGTDSIYDALLEIIDCDGIEELGRAACAAAVGNISDRVLERLGDLEAFEVDVTLIGTAEAAERTGDSRVDAINGTWFTRFHQDGVTVDAPLRAQRY